MFHGLSYKLVTIIVFIGLLSGCSQNEPELSAKEKHLAEYLAESGTDLTKPEINKDWAPEPFDEWDNDIAWRWVSNAGNDCYECIYWTIEVLTSDFGCPNGISASLNAEQNDVVLDDTFEYLSYLGPNQKARMQFEFYDLDGSGSSYQGSLTELSCR